MWDPSLCVSVKINKKKVLALSHLCCARKLLLAHAGEAAASGHAGSIDTQVNDNSTIHEPKS